MSNIAFVVMLALQACGHGPCTAEQAATIAAYRNCEHDLTCTAETIQAKKIEVTESGVTIFRGQ